MSILSWFDCRWVLVNSLDSLFQAGSLGVGSIRGWFMWKASFFVVLSWVHLEGKENEML